MSLNPTVVLKREKLLEDFVEFARLQLTSGDIDPAYPVLRQLQREMPAEQALWHTLVYVAFYNLDSAVRVFAALPSWEDARAQWRRTGLALDFQLASLPTGVERRNLRGGYRMMDHFHSLLALADSFGGLGIWLGAAVHRAPLHDWLTVRSNVEMARGNGRWASYKTAELLQKVNGWELEAPDMGNEFSTGPRHGLALFYGEVEGNSPAAIRRLDGQGRELQNELVMRGLVVGIEQVETLLCDFHAMADGRYYPGHDVDQMQAQLGWGPAGADDYRMPIWRARLASFPLAYLGELGGWNGVDRERCKVYARTGQVLGR